jgi:hypothetical protein
MLIEKIAEKASKRKGKNKNKNKYRVRAYQIFDSLHLKANVNKKKEESQSRRKTQKKRNAINIKFQKINDKLQYYIFIFLFIQKHRTPSNK